ncbi:MAG: transposase [Pseudomonadota bacterium]
MTTRRADSLTHSLLQETVLQEWFQPMQQALDKVRFSDRIFQSLPMLSYALLGGLRQLLSIDTLREQVQTLFHWDVSAERIPVPRSTWSDAMGSRTRRDLLRQATHHLVALAQTTLEDKLSGIEGIGQRPLVAIDATYQAESSHYVRILPTEGGNDNQKGHMLLTYYDLRRGIPVNVKTETSSMGEMRVLKADDAEAMDWSRVHQAIYVVDRAFIDGAYWDERKRSLHATVITRMKSTLVYTRAEPRKVATLPCNEKVLSDYVIALQCAKQPWRLIEWLSPDGITYRYLTNDFSLEPGVVAFLYYRRWDEEKYFDNFKNDLANAKAWGKSPVAIEQQALMGLMTYILTQLFLQRRYQELELPAGDDTQAHKHARKVEHYLEQQAENDHQEYHADAWCQEDEPPDCMQYDAYRAFHAQLSKITRQVWRFLKNCFREKHSLLLYQRQLKPLLLRYL